MGYSTDFDGQFTLAPLPLPADLVLRLYDLEGVNRDETPDMPGVEMMPESSLQWKLTKDRQHLEWDGGEKFYYYVEWLQWLIDFVFTPAGVTVSGAVAYAGEEVTDTGVLTVEEGKVRKQKHALVDQDALSDLQAFYRFVQQHQYGREILEDWREEKKG